ncbi:MAG: hypothetical protein P0S95_00510 [Rhabdochlamydiaceae bacterium]|nr:hypothetical protein [Candidatus Amphrikana amoebophyrae]
MNSTFCLIDGKFAAELISTGVCVVVDPASATSTLSATGYKLVANIAIASASVALGQIVELGCIMATHDDAEKRISSKSLSVILILPQAVTYATASCLGSGIPLAAMSTVTKLCGWLKADEQGTSMWAFSQKLTVASGVLFSAVSTILG